MNAASSPPGRPPRWGSDRAGRPVSPVADGGGADLATTKLPSTSSTLSLTVQLFQPFPKNIFVTGADAGGGPEGAVFNGADASLFNSFFAFDPSFIGGVRIGAVVQPSGLADVIAVEGPQTD